MKIGQLKKTKRSPTNQASVSSLDPITRISDDKELIFVIDFFRMLWNGEIF